jgi:hypothetical protein
MRRGLCQLDHTKMIQSFFRYLPLSLSSLTKFPPLSSLLRRLWVLIIFYFRLNPPSILFFARTARADVGMHFVTEISTFTTCVRELQKWNCRGWQGGTPAQDPP